MHSLKNKNYCSLDSLFIGSMFPLMIWRDALCSEKAIRIIVMHKAKKSSMSHEMYLQFKSLAIIKLHFPSRSNLRISNLVGNNSREGFLCSSLQFFKDIMMLELQFSSSKSFSLSRRLVNTGLEGLGHWVEHQKSK